MYYAYMFVFNITRTQYGTLSSYRQSATEYMYVSALRTKSTDY